MQDRQFKDWYRRTYRPRSATATASLAESIMIRLGPVRLARSPGMLLPDYPEFARLAENATMIPVVKSVSADLLTPVSAFLAVAASEPNAFLLESVERGEQIGRYTFLGARPYMQVEARGQEITILRGKRRERHQGNIFQIVKELLRQHRPATVPGLPPF